MAGRGPMGGGMGLVGGPGRGWRRREEEGGGRGRGGKKVVVGDAEASNRAFVFDEKVFCLELWNYFYFILEPDNPFFPLKALLSAMRVMYTEHSFTNSRSDFNSILLLACGHKRSRR